MKPQAFLRITQAPVMLSKFQSKSCVSQESFDIGDLKFTSPRYATGINMPGPSHTRTEPCDSTRTATASIHKTSLKVGTPAFYLSKVSRFKSIQALQLANSGLIQVRISRIGKVYSGKFQTSFSQTALVSQPSLRDNQVMQVTSNSNFWR